MIKTTEPALTGSGSVPFTAKRIKIKLLTRSALAIRITLLMLALLTIIGFLTFNYEGVNFIKGVLATLSNFKVIFLQPSFDHVTFLGAIGELLITLSLGILTTLLGAIIALFLSLFAARNLSNRMTSNIVKELVAIIRAVPTVLWVLIFAVSAGLGSVAAVIGMSFHSISYLTKAYSESFEEMDKGTIEALEGCGASWWQIVWQAVIPSSMTSMISWTFIRFEVNFGIAVAMGAAAGAGGIGYDMFMDSSYYYNLHEMGAIAYFILIVAMILEYGSVKIKDKIRA
ncbi:PhnE/PtxC family ABC transporter permease [Sporolactobacillus pectinivorans]|uniref:PhnE/PtxC family ABC transporter permease n=1 Tax=Sporolactobacillus pectinivorans TaxID=1591408 RepID=UPI000C2693F8|nr:ABC transporter permease subunit [Sporolactobacillus pectinivorans]